MINNRYIIKKKLGEGRSKVFLCSDIDNPENEYAIKILSEKADSEEIKVFRKEFFTLQNLKHPNIITSYEEGMIVKTDNEEEIFPGSYYIILDYFPGVELLKYSRLYEEGNLNKIIVQICSVLYYLHQSNYIYYDLKPENILVAESGGIPGIKLIDMGFAHHLHISDGYAARGTKEYIAPEILKNEPHNHQVDLYSFGVMLYRIVYGKFPFRSESEIEIYKEHIERNFEYLDNDNSKLNKVIRRLLEKNPVNRYDNSLQVLKDIDENISQDIVKHFTPANVFADRKKVLSQLKNILTGSREKEVIILSGAEGSGKTSLIYKIYSENENIILISSIGRSGINFIRYFLKKVVYDGWVFPHLKSDLIEQAENIISGNLGNLIDNLKSIFTSISREVKFNLIIDDFNLLNEFVFGIFKELIPILQVNGINIIISERNDHPDVANKIFNKIQKINLVPFTEDDLLEYIDISLSNFFPKDQLRKIVLSHSDLLPGSINNFIRDLVLLNGIKFTLDGPEINEDKNAQNLLHSSQEEIFKLRFSLLSDDELKVAQFLSSFENPPDTNAIAVLNNLSSHEVNYIIKNLEEKNIIHSSNFEKNLDFTSESAKKYSYSTIKNREEFHSKLADLIADNYKNFNRNELARQYELGNNFTASYKVLLEEVEEADRLSAFSYKKNLLNHLLQLPLPKEFEFELKYKLSFTFSKLNDAKSTLDLVNDLISKTEDKNIKDELLILRGSSLIELGEIEEGKNILKQLVENIDDEVRKQKLMVEIAYAEFDIGKYDVAKEICKGILTDKFTLFEEKGKCYNLLGLLYTYQENNYDEALRNFQNGLIAYTSENLYSNVAKIEVNIGNTFFWKGDFQNAEKFWKSAIHRNQSIGNLDQEAKTLLNFGIFYYNEAKFDFALNQYIRADQIFSNLGNNNGKGLVLYNLGEAYLSNCEFENALNSLLEAKQIYEHLLKIEEKAEILFLLAKLYYIVGDAKQLERVVYDYKYIIDKNNLPERHYNNNKYLRILQGKISDYLNNLNYVLGFFKKQNEGLFFIEGVFYLCENLIKSKFYEQAYDLLGDDKFNEACKNNYLSKAIKKYLESLISSQTNKFALLAPIESLEEAFDLVKEENITELTWKILFSLGENYLNRGNFKKAEENLIFSKEVINFIASNIKNESLKSIYLSKPERKSVFQKIETIQKK